MTIFYTASYYGKKEYQRQYDYILEVLNKTKEKIISTEGGNYLSVLSKEEQEELRHPKLIHYEAIRKGILQSDVVIIEISEEDFQLGHEASLAIQNKRPVLCLSVNEDFSIKINNPYFFARKYNHYNVEDIITEFIHSTSNRLLSERFNLFMSPSQLDYLDKAARAENIGKSEYLRELLEKDRFVKNL